MDDATKLIRIPIESFSYSKQSDIIKVIWRSDVWTNKLNLNVGLLQGCTTQFSWRTQSFLAFLRAKPYMFLHIKGCFYEMNKILG